MFFFNKCKLSIDSDSYIIAGLGNPGREYSETRHNIGFLAVDYMAEFFSCNVTRLKFKSLCGDCNIDGAKAYFLKPQTYMNLSGEAVRDAAQFYKIDMDHVIIIYDDVALPLGKLRIRSQGSDGGHNGIKSIIYQNNTDVFPRIKIGVGMPDNPDYNLADWVTGRFTDDEKKVVFDTLKKSAEIVKLIVSGKIENAMNKYN